MQNHLLFLGNLYLECINNKFPNLIKIKFHVDQLYCHSVTFFSPHWELIKLTTMI